MIKRLIPSCFIVLFVFSNSAYSHTHYGRVVKVSDGDTIKILTSDNRQLKIRLAEIDAPEKKQAYGKNAANALAHMINNTLIKVEWVSKDRYGRLIGKVYFEGEYINAAMVLAGHAWVYRKYSKNEKLLNLENKAKEAKLGLWANTNPTAPWAWRIKIRRMLSKRITM